MWKLVGMYGNLRLRKGDLEGWVIFPSKAGMCNFIASVWEWKNGKRKLIAEDKQILSKDLAKQFVMKRMKGQKSWLE